MNLGDLVVPLLTIIAGAVAGSVTAIITGRQQKRKIDAEAESIETDASAKVVEMALDLAKSNELRADKFAMLLEEREDDIRMLQGTLAEVWNGNIHNIRQLEEAGMRPKYHPPGSELKVRGHANEILGLEMLDKQKYALNADGMMTWHPDGGD